ncbi:MAG TPA: LCCL domain-containing protein [Iamia sp.]|nr:LCCL domain-containing protein [Iamia sp.]
MRTPTVRRLAVPALAALLVLAGCSDDGDDGDAASSTTEEQAGETSTTADEGATTTAPDDEGDAGGDPTTTEAGEDPEDTPPDTSDQGQEGTGAPDAEAPDVSWDLNAAQYRGEDGKRIAFLCPPDGEIGSVWGTETYTDDSSVCSAAVHAGIINPVEGGRVVIEIAPGEESYEGSEANAVTSQDYGSWPGSFTFPVG